VKEDASMSDVEHEQPQDDATVEITGIDGLDSVAADGKTVSSTKPLRSRLEAGVSAHRHRLQLVVTAGIVVLALLVILGSTAPVRELVSGAFIRPAPTPTPTLAPGVGLFYVQGNPPWGQLSIDGKALAHLPRISYDPPLRLARGRHVLVWKADPFLSSRCTVSVPASYATDTCHYNQTVQLNSGLSAYIITFSVSLTSLPTDQRAALIQATQVALDAQQSTDIVQPGELYALAPNDPKCRDAPGQPLCYATARQPLKATLSFQLDANEASDEACIDPEPSCTFSHQNCHLFCPGFDSGLSAAQAWDVFATVRPLWKFATLDGRVLAHDVPDNSLWDYATGQTIDESLVPLRITWDSLGWHVTVSHDGSASDAGFFDPACAAAQDEVQFFEPPAVAGEPVYLQWQYASGSVPAVGCIALGSPQPNPGTTPTPSSSQAAVAYCLHRFGVNLAANELAQRYWPYLPVADAREQLLAQQLAALVSGPPS
jgi:hypothetical protein